MKFKVIVFASLFGLFFVSCSNNNDKAMEAEKQEIEQLKKELQELEAVNEELTKIQEEGAQLDSLLNELEE